MTELPSNAFRFGNYNADIPTKVFCSDILLIKWLKEHSIIGYCKEPLFKPIKDHTAVLIDLEDQGEYWSHIPNNIWKRYLIFSSTV